MRAVFNFDKSGPVPMLQNKIFFCSWNMKELRNYSCLLAYPIIASYYCSVDDMMGLEKSVAF